MVYDYAEVVDLNKDSVLESNKDIRVNLHGCK